MYFVIVVTASTQHSLNNSLLMYTSRYKTLSQGVRDNTPCSARQYEAHEYWTSRELKSGTYRSQCDKRMNKGTIGAPHSEDKLKFLATFLESQFGTGFDNA